MPPDDACAPKQAHLAFDVERWDGQTFHLEADAKQSEDDGTMMLFAKFVGDHPLGVTFAISIFYPTGKVAPQTPYVSSVGSDVYMLVAHAADARPNSDATVGVATGGSIIFSQVTATECEPVGGTFDGLEYTSNNSAFPLKKIRLSNGAFRSNPL